MANEDWWKAQGTPVAQGEDWWSSAGTPDAPTQATPAPAAIEQPETGDFMRGLKRVLPEAKQLIGGTMVAIGDKTGWDGLRDKGLDIYKGQDAVLQPLQKPTDSASEAWKQVKQGNLGAGVDFLQNAAGYTSGQALESLAAAGVGAAVGGIATPEVAGAGAVPGAIGGFLAKKALRSAVKSEADRIIAEQVAKGVARSEAKKFGAEYVAKNAAEDVIAKQVGERYTQAQLRKLGGRAAGAAAGAQGMNTVMELGSVYPEAYQKAQDEGRQMTAWEQNKAIGASLAAAGLESAADLFNLGILFRGAKGAARDTAERGLRQAVKAYGKRAAVAGTEGALREAGTEAAQTGLERFGAGQSLNDPDAWRDYIDSAAVGAVGGVLFGGAAALRQEKEAGPASFGKDPLDSARADYAEAKASGDPSAIRQAQQKLADELAQTGRVQPRTDSGTTADATEMPNSSQPAIDDAAFAQPDPAQMAANMRMQAQVQRANAKTVLGRAAADATDMQADAVADVPFDMSGMGATHNNEAPVDGFTRLGAIAQGLNLDPEAIVAAARADVGDDPRYSLDGLDDRILTTYAQSLASTVQPAQAQDGSPSEGAVGFQPTPVQAPPVEAQSGQANPVEGGGLAGESPVVAGDEPALASVPAAGTQAQEVSTASNASPQKVAEPRAIAAPEQSGYDESQDILDSDITTPSGTPFTIRDAADRAAVRHEGGRVFPVDGGFVVRVPSPQASAIAASAPQNSEATRESERLRATTVQAPQAQADEEPQASSVPGPTQAPESQSQVRMQSAAETSPQTHAAAPAQPEVRSESASVPSPQVTLAPDSPQARQAAREASIPADLLAKRDAATERLNAASAAMQQFPTGNMGLPPDAVKATPEWKAAKIELDRAAVAARNANAEVVKARKAKPAKPAPQEPATPAQQEPLQATAPGEVESLRSQLRDVESAILRKAPAKFSAGGGDIEGAAKHKQVPTPLKEQRKAIKAKLQSLQQVAPIAEATVPADSNIPLSAAAKTSKAAKASSKGKADDRAAALASYFKPGNIIKSYAGYDEVLSYRPADGNRSMQVDVHEVRKVNGEWVRVGKPQDARWHSTLPDTSELKAGPIDTVPAGDATYTEPRADGQPFPNAPRRGAQGATATHADPGEAPEAVTPAVIADAAKTADRAPTVSMAEARKVLLAKLDAAIKAAPNEGVLDNPPTTKASKNNGRKAWEVNIGRTLDNGLKVPALTIVESHDGNTYSIGIGGKVLPVGHKDNTLAKEGSLLAARLTAARMQQGADWKPSGTNGKWTFNPVPASDTDMITLDVPGDGTFKVKNTKERLTAFRKQVESFFNLPKQETPKPESLTVSQATRDKIMAEAETVGDAVPEQPAPSQQQTAPDKKEPFDSEKFYAGRAAVVKASREAGNVHLDTVGSSVEAMRAYTIFDVHNPSDRGVIDTVDNRGNVYVLNEDGTEMTLGPSDLKDFAMAKVPRMEPKAFKALRKKFEKANAAKKEANAMAQRAAAAARVDAMLATSREVRPLLDAAENGTQAQREAAQEYLDGNIDLAEFKAAMDSTPATQPAPSADRGEEKAKPEATAKIDDFGEKLEGARKFLPPSLKEPLGDDQIASLPLSKIWPSDAHMEIEDPMTAAMAFTARDEIPAKPRVARKVAAWVAQVKMFRGLMQKFNEESMPRLLEIAAEKGFASLLNGFFPRVQLLAQLPREEWKRVEKVGQWPNARRMLTNAEMVEKGIVREIRQDASRYHDYFKVDKATGERTKISTLGDDADILWAPNPHSDVTIDGKTHTFPVPAIGPEEVQKVKELLGAAPPPQTGLTAKDFEIRSNSATGLTFINRKGDSAYRPLKAFAGTKNETVKEARAYLAANVPALSEMWEAVKARDNVGKGEVRRADNAERQGPNRRDGKDVTAEMFTNAFGFRGVQFGNWVKQGKGSKDRQGLLNAAYDGLLDLADLLGIPSKAISLEGTLGLALGSQGVGKHAATFFPQDLVINLTKMRGAGSLAHEWFHALDNYFARKRGGEVKFTGNNQHYRENNYITYKPEPLLRSTKGFGEMTKAEVERRRALHPSAKEYLPENWERSPNHREGVRPVVEKAFAELVATLNASPMMKRSADIDGLKIYSDGLTAGDAYWSRIIERGARSFETYVISKMAQRGWSNDFLANIRSLDQWTGLGKNPDRYPYPKPEEEASIADAFDKLFSTIESRETDNGNVALENVEDTAADWLTNIEADESSTNGDIDADRLGLRKAVNGLLGKSGLRVEYLRGYAGLPEGLRNAVESRNAMGRKGQTAALYDPETKRVFVFTHVVRTPERAAWNAAHEIAGHDGLRKLLGKRLDEVLELADKNPTVSDLADEIAVQRKLTPAQRLLAVEEALAELAAAVRTGDYGRIQEKYKIAVPEGIRARVAQVVTNFLRRLKELLQNRTGVVFKDADVRALLENAWQAAQSDAATTGDAAMESVDNAGMKPNLPRTRVVDDAGEPLLVYHSGKEKIDRFDSAKTVDGGFHFGTAEQAGMRAGRKAETVAAYLDIRNPRRSKDMGGNWKSKIASAKSAGHDGIVYLNRYEGMTVERITALQASGKLNKLDGMSDAEFKRAVPEARDSYIAFDDKQIIRSTIGTPSSALESTEDQPQSEAFRRWFGSSGPLAVLPSQAAMLEGRPDGNASNSKSAPDLLESQAFRLQGLSGLDVPAQREVLDGVLALGQDRKVLNSVVELIPVEVVNVLRDKKLSPEMLFHNEAVLKDILSADANGSVATAIDVADALVGAVARVATEGSAIATNPLARPSERDTASGADNRDHLHTASINQTANNGNFDPDNPSILESVEDDLFEVNTPETITAADLKIPGQIAVKREGVKGWLNAAGKKLTDLKPAALALVPLNHLADFASKGMTAVQQYVDQHYAMQAYRNGLYRDYDAIAQDWLKYASGTGIKGFLGKAATQAGRDLSDLMHDSTIAGIDPSVENASYKEVEKQRIYNELRARYMAMPEHGQALFKRVRDAYARQSRMLEEVIEANLKRAMEINKSKAERDYEDRIREIDESGASEDEKARLKANAANLHDDRVKEADQRTNAKTMALRATFESMRVEAPYFPLKRYGNYWVTVLKNGTMQGFSKFQTAEEQDAFVKQMKAQGFDVRTKYEGGDTKTHEMIDPSFIAEIEGILDGAQMPDSVKDDIWQAYLERMPDMSLRKSFIHRQKVQGYHPDALRAFSSTSFHGSYQLARLKYGMEMAETLDIAEKQAARVAPVQGEQLVGELRKRHAFIMNPTGGALAQGLTTAAFVYYLGANPAHLLLNATQTVMLGIPILGARYGFGRTTNALQKAMRDFAIGKGQLENANLTADERKAFQAFIDSGLIDKTQAHDLAGVGETGVEYNAVRQKVMNKIGWFFHQSERFNREVTAMAAYRLARQDGRSHDVAVSQAMRATYDIHFDYSAAARARVMQGDVAKSLLVFRNYQVNILYRLFRDIHQSLRGESVQVRREARKQLGAMMGMYGLFAGVAGMPFYGLAMALAGAFEDDDDPETAEQQFVRGTVELLGPDVARVLLKGVPGATFNIDLTDRIGMPNLWFRSPDRELEGRDAYYYWMEQVLGAGVGVIKQGYDGASLIFEGLQDANSGHVARGFEKMLPAAVRNVFKSVRYSADGVTTLNGEKILDLGAGGLVAQGLGYTPLDLAERYDANRDLKNANAKLERRRRALLDRLFLASQHGDPTDSAMLDIQAFNAKNPDYAITRQTIDRSAKLRNRNRLLNENGIVMTRRMRRLQERMSGSEEADE